MKWEGQLSAIHAITFVFGGKFLLNCIPCYHAFRSNLQTLCLYFLTNNAVSEEVVPVVIQLLVRVVPNVEERLQVLAEAISEVREPMTEQEPELESAGPPPEPLPTMTAEELRQKELKVFIFQFFLLIHSFTKAFSMNFYLYLFIYLASCNSC